MKQNLIRLIADSYISPVLPKLFEGVKNDFFVLLGEFGSENSKTTPNEVKNVIFTCLTSAYLVQSKQKKY